MTFNDNELETMLLALNEGMSQAAQGGNMDIWNKYRKVYDKVWKYLYEKGIV